MKDFMNYTSILGILDSFSDEKLDETIKEYEFEKDKQLSAYNLAAHNHDFLLKNINALKEVKERRRLVSIERNFILKKEHLHILKSMWCNNINKDKLTLTLPREEEIAKIFEIKHYDKDGDYLPDDADKINLVIEELHLALKLILNEKN